jgi:hypothetical protein
VLDRTPFLRTAPVSSGQHGTQYTVSLHRPTLVSRKVKLDVNPLHYHRCSRRISEVFSSCIAGTPMRPYDSTDRGTKA